MSCKAKSVTVELIGLKKKSALDEVIDTVAKPKGAIPTFGLPRWKIMPLESKIPMIPGPEGSYCFTRRKLGRKLWISSADAEFNLSDPCNYEVEFTYEPLHDEHLAPFFSQPNNLRRMLKLGFITKKLDAICSLRDYNMYRKYLKKQHNDSINKELRHRGRLDDERRTLYIAEERAQLEMERLKARERIIEASKEQHERRRLEEEAAIQRQKNREMKLAQRLELIILARKEDARMRLEKGKERSEIIKQKRIAADQIERRKIIKTLVEWNRSERERKKAKEERRSRELQEKRQAILDKWELRKDLQRKQIARELFLRQCEHQEHLMNVQAYNNKVEGERKRLRVWQLKLKQFNECYTRRHLSAGKREGTCCYKRRRKHKTDEDEILKAPCPSKPHPNFYKEMKKAEKQQKEKEKREKKNEKEKKRKKKSKKKKKKIVAPEPRAECKPEPEPIEIELPPPAPPLPPPSPPQDKCLCEDIKAKWLKAHKDDI